VPLSSVQKGAVGQLAFLASALVTGGGQIEAYPPASDNEGRDAQIRHHLKSTPGISLQIKVAFHSSTNAGGRAKLLRIVFGLRPKSVQRDPRLWFFLAFYDTNELRFHDPVFLVPSETFYKLARRPAVTGGRKWFAFEGSMETKSRDQWVPYRVAPRDLGKRLLEIVDSAALTRSKDRDASFPAGAIWLGRRARSSSR